MASGYVSAIFVATRCQAVEPEENVHRCFHRLAASGYMAVAGSCLVGAV